MILNQLELTFIPANYWNENASGFKLISKGKELPKNTNFFLLWIPSNPPQKELIKRISNMFPNIPASKLLSCELNLAIPNSENEANSKNYYCISAVKGKIIPIAPAVNILYQLEIIERQDRSARHYSNSVKSWAFLTKLIFELLNKGQFVPILKPQKETIYRGQWQLLLKSQNDGDRFKAIINNSPWSAFNLPINFIIQNSSYKTSGFWHPSYIFSNYMDVVGDYLIRFTLNKNKFPTFKEFYSTEIKKESDPSYKLGWDYKFLKSLIRKDPSFKIHEYHETIIPTLIRNWIQSTQGFAFKHGSFFNLELQYPKEPDGDWPLVFYLSLQEDSKPIPLREIWEGGSKIIKTISKLFDNEEHYIEVILRALGTASKIFPPINRALDEKFPYEVMLTSTEVMDFLRYPKDLLIQGGFNVILPKAFSIGGKQRVSARLIIKSKETKETKKGASTTLPSIFDINSMIDYKWEASLGDQKITEEEFNNLINSDEPLINLRGEWILIDQQDIEDLRNASETGEKSYMEALKLGLTGNIQLRENGNNYEVVVEGDLNEIVQKLSSIESFEEISCPTSFNGILRHYQEDGLTWMGNMSPFNFGLCLADDMGLGKTIQVIAFLLHLKDIYPNDAGSTLIICPTSVLFNWKRELNKFAPDLNVIFHHGPNRVKNASGIKNFLQPHQIILTSYGTIRNDVKFLQSIPFMGVIIDESQNIKNHESQQAQAILKLQSQYRIGLSGTPIENRLLELWSLFEFLNPGLLGTKSEFQNNFILPIERFQDQEAINKLKLIISPFILRRLKSDKSIIDDLPAKNEMKVYIDLSDEQAKLYQNLVSESLKQIANETSDKRKKRGLILGLLVKLKQICNHPYQYLKEDFESIENEEKLKQFLSQSNKVERLLEMTEEVISNGEKLLIFTQFKQMGDILQKMFEQKYDFDVLFFHGSVSQKDRTRIVDDFQSEDLNSPPILILSLKAGGTGLNLTQGTTVIHFDRWWNPAVEDQATDRAYRIGQKSRVNVYKYITHGTIEEKIDALLEEKRDLADKIVTTTGESWISDLSEDKLKELLLLSN